MRVVLEKMPGVEWVEVSLAKASADINLKEDNPVTMRQLRDVLKKAGYPTADARIDARGQITSTSGKLTFDLLNGNTMALVADANSKSAAEAPQPVNISGVSRTDGNAGDTLIVTAIR